MTAGEPQNTETEQDSVNYDTEKETDSANPSQRQSKKRVRIEKGGFGSDTKRVSGSRYVV